jgi:hypothetical protein
LQSLVTTFTNMELEIRVKRFIRMTEAIADYVGREYSKEMKLLVKMLELKIKYKHGGFNINYEKATVVWQQFGFGL